jgi:hypothetical protein
MSKILSSLLLLISTMSIFAQGSLTPPGAPAPTMKTLNQIEGRTVIDPSVPGFTTPYTISQPGSYYLSGNINISNGTGAIVISSDDVTLDLNGFVLNSTSNPAAGTAISIPGGHSNVTVRNGHIRGQVLFTGSSFSGTGFAEGIRAFVNNNNIRISDIAVMGCSSAGIYTSINLLNTVVERCTIINVGGPGIFADLVVSSSVSITGGTGIEARTVSDCTVYSKSGGVAIYGGTVQNCYGYNASTATFTAGILGTTVINSYGYGVIGIKTTTVGIGSSTTAGSATNCVGVGHNDVGISTDVATGCRGESDTASGIFANYMAMNCIGISSSGRGLWTSIATNCFGQTATGDYALLAASANTCRGWQTDNTGVAIHVDALAIGCSSPGGTIEAPAGQKYLMP